MRLKRGGRGARGGSGEGNENEVVFVTAREDVRVWKYLKKEREVRLWRETDAGDLLVNKIVVTPQRSLVASSFNEELKVFQ